MQFGLFLLLPMREWSSPREVYRNTVEQVELAEALGFDAVWLAEHHFSRWGICPNILTFAANLAARTKRVRIGTAVLVLPFYNPLIVAEEAATVDVLSDGRLDFGIGRGYQRHEFDAFEIDPVESRARFLEAHDLILETWTKERATYEGKFYRAKDLWLLPKPVQQPHPPIWMAVSQSPESIEFAAERGYPMLQATTATLANIKKNFAYYRECAARAGHDVTNVPLPVTRAINVAENGDEARAEMAEPLEWYLGYARQVGLPATDRGDRVFDEAYKHWKDTRGAFQLDPTEVAENLGIIGSPDQCGAKLQTLQSELGLNYLNCAFGVGGAPQERILRSMRLFAERVMPQFRSAPAEVGV